MRELRQKRNAQLSKDDRETYTIPKTMINSIRQSMRLSGYYISESEARKVIENSLKT